MVQFVLFFLEDRGIAWWETAERMLSRDVSKITWEQFKERFYAKFFSANVRYAKQQKFLNLEQGDMTIEKYDAEFDMLSRFAPEVVKDEATKTEKFVRGLRLDFQGGHFQRHHQELAATGKTVKELPACRSCERYHGGRCLAGIGVCFRCKQPGHTVDFCPQKLLETTSNQTPTPQLGRVFATIRQEAEQVGTVVTEVEPLSSMLSISTSSGEVMLSKDKIKACQVGIANHVLDVTLLVLDMWDFKVILGMDWLSANHASIECSCKEVVFNPPSATSFKFKRGGTVVLPKVISVMKASKLLNQGTWSILANIVDTREPEVSMSSESVVREEIDFVIELVPDTAPISRAPYRIAPDELKELKVQLQELLDKGFIRPGVSP
ncbi:uncharacterized protein LOC127149744 [Cucumis melo]|uniref:Uncharacterized protein LOC127149744 n=1 Tax=Cucumis melo TaxID=3656 RepID=A0ABM3KUW3_CUCME|nr:uncharacterized protein LOC127149744 [Cucumis melo]